uniref:Uncharacterized protein n=1 Tax=Rhizophora mucronata TaxID=61149 RepID=A0A2P2QY28_RHIMU
MTLYVQLCNNLAKAKFLFESFAEMLVNLACIGYANQFVSLRKCNYVHLSNGEKSTIFQRNWKWRLWYLTNRKKK